MASRPSASISASGFVPDGHWIFDQQNRLMPSPSPAPTRSRAILHLDLARHTVRLVGRDYAGLPCTLHNEGKLLFVDGHEVAPEVFKAMLHGFTVEELELSGPSEAGDLVWEVELAPGSLARGAGL